MAGCERLSDQVRLVARIKLVSEVLYMPFDGPRRDPQLQGALFGRESACNAIEHFALSFRQSDEIFLLPRKIHHSLRCWGYFAPAQLISLVITGLQ